MMIELEGDQWLRSGFLEGWLGMALGVRKAVRWVGEQPLLRSQLVVVQAVAAVCGGEVQGDVGSRVLVFEPGQKRLGGECVFRVGLGRGVGQVLGAVLPGLLFGGGIADDGATLTLHGSTHAPWDMPLDHWCWSMGPLYRRMGAELEIVQAQAGFFPAGGGITKVLTKPTVQAQPLQIIRRTSIQKRRGVIWLAHLSASIAERQRKRICNRLHWDEDLIDMMRAPEALSAGNALSLVVEVEASNPPNTDPIPLTVTFSSVGEVNRSAESVAEDAIENLKHYLASSAPVSGSMLRHLIVPMLLAGRGSICTSSPDAPTLALLKIAPYFFDTPHTLARTEDEGRMFRFDVGQPPNNQDILLNT